MDTAWCTICNRHCADDNVCIFIFWITFLQQQMINMLVLSFSHFIALKTAASKILKFPLQPIFHPFRFRLPLLHASHTHAIHRPSHPTTMVAISFHHLPARLQVLSWTPDTIHHHQTMLCIQHDLPDNFQQQEEKKKNHLPALVSFCTPTTNQDRFPKTQRTIGSQKIKSWPLRTDNFSHPHTTLLHIRAGFNTCLQNNKKQTYFSKKQLVHSSSCHPSWRNKKVHLVMLYIPSSLWSIIRSPHQHYGYTLFVDQWHKKKMLFF